MVIYYYYAFQVIGLEIDRNLIKFKFDIDFYCFFSCASEMTIFEKVQSNRKMVLKCRHQHQKQNLIKKLNEANREYQLD